MPTAEQIYRVARALYEEEPLIRRGWPGEGEKVRWGDAVCYRGTAVDRTQKYFRRAEVALRAMECTELPSEDR